MKIGCLANRWTGLTGLMKTPVSCAALALIVGVMGGQPLYGAPNCSNRDLKGVYGLLATGTNVVAPPPAPLGPIVWGGWVEADGSGNMSIRNTASYNGAIVTESYTATYTVNSDCSVTIKPVVPLPIGPGGSLVPIPFELVGALADGGNDVAVMVCGINAPCFGTPPGAVLRLHLSRQNNNGGSCSTRDLSGAFQLDMAGSVVIGGPVAGPFARVGRLVFDGRGEFRGHATASYSGLALLPEDFIGNYSVDSRCTISMGYLGAFGATHTWTGTLTDGSNGADIIVVESGVAIAGTLKKQRPRNGPE